MDNGSVLYALGKEPFFSTAFSPNGDIVASGAVWNGTVKLWRVSDGTLLHSLEGHTSAVSSVAFSPDGTVLASTGLDGTIKLWRVSDGSLLRILEENLVVPHK
ncbi:MAG: hypothetical protein GY867_00590 [bacterium]|nr:hypothetical protein [bacterium]